MHVRNLGINFSIVGSEPFLDKIVPTYLLGLLTIGFQPAWEASFEALDKVKDKSPDYLWEIIHQWLLIDVGVPEPAEPESQPVYTVSCSNLSMLLNTSSKITSELSHPRETLHDIVQAATKNPQMPQNIRLQCIKVLQRMPRLAEKHGRDLVPLLLRKGEVEYMDDEDGEKAKLNAPERIELLNLFALFNNAKGLYKCNEVYDEVLFLLGNRNVSIQQSALKCVFTFKDATIKKYRANLMALLDDTQFKDELMTIVRGSGDEGTIHKEDRSTVFPLIVRILYGRAQVAKTGGVKQNRRFAVLNSLNYLEPDYISLFVSLSAEGLGDYKSLLVPEPAWVKDRQVLGFLTMLHDTIEQLQGNLKNSFDTIMEKLIFCLIQANNRSSDTELPPIDLKAARSSRQLGWKCLAGLLKYAEDFDFSSYFDVIYTNLIAEQLSTFAKSNLEQPSSLMRVFGTLSTTPTLCELLVAHGSGIVIALFETLTFQEVKDQVLELVFSVLNNLLEARKNEMVPGAASKALSIVVPIVLARLPTLFERPSSGQMIETEANILVNLLKSYEADNSVRENLLKAALAALERKLRVPIKATILEALAVLLVDERSSLEEALNAYNALSRLFKQFSDKTARENLSKVFQVFSERYSDIFGPVGLLVVDLNSYSTKRIELPDFDRRLAAFASINEAGYKQFSELQWTPLLYNMLYFVKDPEELALRTNATYSLKRFVDSLSFHGEKESFVKLLDEIVLPAVKTGLRDQKDILRKEIIDFLGYLIKTISWDSASGLGDMKALLFNGDEEANFFNNVGHIQIHRRGRAVRRLVSVVSEGKLSDISIAHYILPIIEHFVGKTGDEAHTVSEESLKAIAVLIRHVSWNQYRAITKRYVSYVSSRPESMKVNIRLIDCSAEALGWTLESSNRSNKNARLLSNVPKPEKLSVFITDEILSPMHNVLTDRNNTNENLTERIPLGVPIVKFVKCLPEELLTLKLPGILTGMCQMLRAKSQELRDLVRTTLGKIAEVLGAKYLVFLVRELKGALRRGTQLHVLGYTIHSLLVEMENVLVPGDLDDSSALIGEIVMEDIFGATGSEKDEEGFISKMKEIKQRKSFDSGQILAKNISLSAFGNLMDPVRTLLLFSKVSLKMERNVEELLRRFAQGLYHNVQAGSQDVLVMAYELYRQVEEEEKQLEESGQNLTHRDIQQKAAEEYFTVRLDSRHWNGKKKSKNVQNLHIILRFVMDALRTVLGKNENLMTAENVAGFLPMLDRGIKAKFEDVQIASLRLLAFIIKLPIPNLGPRLAVYGLRTLELIKSCSSTNSELCQASLRFLSVMIRQKPDFSLSNSTLAYVLNRIMPDLEEPDRQGITFTFLKAVLSRQIVIPEVYDVMDRVAQIMVTNHSRVIRDTCRSTYYQFLMEYPQGDARRKKQFQFLVSNLEYPSYHGRLSVMELIHLIITKVNDEQIEDTTTSFFVALVLVMINDDHSQCRENAALLIKELFERLKQKQIELVESYCLRWLTSEQPALIRGGFQISGMYLTQFGIKQSPKLLKVAKQRVGKVLQSGRPGSDGEVPWETLYFALKLFEKLSAVDSSIFEDNEMWSLVENSLLYPHAWIRLASCRLMGLLYSEGGKADAVKTENLRTTASKYARQLGAPSITEELGIQIVKNLVFICRRWQEENVVEDKDEEDEGENEEDREEDDGEQKVITPFNWLIRRVSVILRSDKDAHLMVVSKRSSIQILAAIVQIVSDEAMEKLGQDIILAVYLYSVSDEEQHKQYRDMSIETLSMVEAKMGTTDYLHAYSQVKTKIEERRIERRSKRVIQAVAEPERFNKRKIHRNMVKKDKRKRVKDLSGYYHGKKRRV